MAYQPVATWIGGVPLADLVGFRIDPLLERFWGVKPGVCPRHIRIKIPFDLFAIATVDAELPIFLAEDP